MSKIQQVVYNLIDNAIKFSHHDSEITIETTKKSEKVFVSVKDTGIGIPKDSQNKIFEQKRNRTWAFDRKRNYSGT